jgi:predicted peptidase
MLGTKTLWRGLALCAVFASGAACLSAFGAGHPAGSTEGEFKQDVTIHAEYKYLQWLPEGYEQGDTKWPLLVFLHGAGETGNDLKKILAHGPPKLAEQGRKFPFILVAPQAPRLIWNPYAVNALVKDRIANLKVDPTRVWLTGLSMGGNGTWMAASIEPELYAAAVPVCGWGDYFLVRRMRNVAVWAFHGEADPIVPVAQTQIVVDSLKTTGAKPKLTTYPGVGHDSWVKAYEDPELWTWLEQQKTDR